MKTDIVSWVREQWDRCAAWACVLTGIVLLVVGWIGASGTPFTSKQIPYLISAGLGGLFALGLGAMLWLSADLRDEWRMLEQIDRSIQEHGTAGLPLVEPESAARPAGEHRAKHTVPVSNGSAVAHR